MADRLTQALLDTLPDAPSSWQDPQHQATARERFAAIGAPTLRTEAWRYTPLRGLDKRLRAPQAAPALEGLAFLEGSAPLILSGDQPVGDLPQVDGVRLGRLSVLAGQGDAIVRDHLGTVCTTAQRPFQDLNAAAGADGVLIHVPAGSTAAKPLHLMVTPGQTVRPTLPLRLLIVVEDNATLTLIEELRGFSAALGNVVVEIRLGANAQLSHLRLQALPQTEMMVGTTLIEAARDARYEGFTLSTGAALARHDLHTRLIGSNSEAKVDGLHLARGRQHLDTSSYIEHEVPHTRSDQTYRTVLADHAQGVFQGKIKVHQDAQKTDGYQLNRALLLSPTAVMNAKPELEIFADDVRCSHGATTGQLSAQELFYLRSRGIPLAQARRLLVAGFMGESLTLITHDGLRAVATEAVEAWMDGLTAAETSAGQEGA